MHVRATLPVIMTYPNECEARLYLSCAVSLCGGYFTTWSMVKCFTNGLHSVHWLHLLLIALECMMVGLRFVSRVCLC